MKSKITTITILLFIVVSFFNISYGQESTKPEDLTNKWYNKINLRGYAQLRYNTFQTNPDLQCLQCDRSWGGENEGFFFRRIRLIFFGQVHEKVFIYIQPDLASGGSNLAQIRDAYFDLALDDNQEFRIRIGQSKVPFGFENLQSSQNRLPLDRNDALNSAVLNERDLGVFFYYAPKEIRKRFSYLVSSGLKGSGDYGVFGIGVYNGQTANLAERNKNQHIVSRLTYPFKLESGQFIEASLQGYTGKFVINRDPSIPGQTEFKEWRYGPTFVLYPQPFGLQIEYNWGIGPQYDNTLNDVINDKIEGGYIMANYMIKNNKDIFIPFTRFHYYDGGKKFELDATKHIVNEFEIGIEWQPNPNFELVTMWTYSDRTFQNSQNPVNRHFGSLLRIQAQVNF